MKIYLVLDNIRSTYNVGAILRTAEGFGVERVYLSGVTPRYDDARVLPHLKEKLNKQIAKTALGAEKMVKIYACDDINTTLDELKREEGAKVLGLENNIRDARLLQIGSEKMSELLSALRVLEKPVVLVLGEEVNGISNPLYEIIDNFLEIPMRGQKESFNVSVATGIALFALVFGS
ncbi:TrmH family RNA methyltransferase [Candidatus Saccharibacteria bacterium]|nr:TrmH family RNA methyltransferase [Candidatus Saccharibacteria bacterium]